MKYWKENMPNAIESGRVKLQSSFNLYLHPPGVDTADIWVAKARISLRPNLRGKRTSPSSSSPK